METAATSLTPQKVETLSAIGEQIIYLMGASFLLGSLITLLLLLILDFIRAKRAESEVLEE